MAYLGMGKSENRSSTWANRSVLSLMVKGDSVGLGRGGGRVCGLQCECGSVPFAMVMAPLLTIFLCKNDLPGF